MSGILFFISNFTQTFFMDLICFCHIRWDFVYQRPQHLLNRFAIYNRVFVIEEPYFDQDENKVAIERSADDVNLWVVKLSVTRQDSDTKTFEIIKDLISNMISSQNITRYLLWYYSPMALQYSDHLKPTIIIYDAMDELTAFKFAPPELKDLESVLLSKADVVFTGGQSLYEAKKHLHHNIHAFPSSIDRVHFGKARINTEEPEDQKPIPHPRLGFYGVIDERFDISLVDEVTDLQPDWHFILIGPVVKIDSKLLPKKTNIHYLGSKSYDSLPAYLAGWDIATLPFALNESTKYISPTKTPEYLAGGKPVISTSITDVVNPYGKKDLVKIADTADEFVNAAKEIFASDDNKIWLQRTDEFLSKNSWNKTWHQMNVLIKQALLKKNIKNPKKLKLYV
jgi:glycosyltransferase involved in cell wall biosynthesis